jgi:hypothetical protein
LLERARPPRPVGLWLIGDNVVDWLILGLLLVLARILAHIPIRTILSACRCFEDWMVGIECCGHQHGNLDVLWRT